MTRKDFEFFAVSFGDQIAHAVGMAKETSAARTMAYMEATTDAIELSRIAFADSNRAFDRDRYNLRILTIACKTLKTWSEYQGVDILGDENRSLWVLEKATKRLFRYDTPIKILKSLNI